MLSFSCTSCYRSQGQLLDPQHMLESMLVNSVQIKIFVMELCKIRNTFLHMSCKFSVHSYLSSIRKKNCSSKVPNDLKILVIWLKLFSELKLTHQSFIFRKHNCFFRWFLNLMTDGFLLLVPTILYLIFLSISLKIFRYWISILCKFS